MSRPVGQVDRLPSGRFRARLPVDGKRITIGTYATPEEARADLERAAVVGAKAVLDPVDSLARFGERVITRWLRTKRGSRRAAANDSRTWQAHVVGSALGARPLRSVSRSDLRAWTDGLLRAGLSATTVRAYLTVVRRVLAVALDEERITAIPTRVRVAGEVESAWTYLTPEEQDRLLSCEAIPEADRCVIALALYTGLRAGEICALRLADVRPTEITVRFGSTPSGPTKTRRTRVVPLVPAAQAWWERWSRVRPESPFAIAAARGGHRHENRPLGRTGRWSAYLELAGIDRRIRWHDLRHTCASSLIAGWWGRVWALHEVRDLLGHTKVAMTERYAHLAPTHLAAVAAATVAPRPPHGDAESKGNTGRIALVAHSETESGSRAVPGGYDVSWGDRGADALRSMVAGDPGPAVALVSEAIEARRSADALERAWSRWVATGRIAALVDAIEALRDGSRRRAAR